MKQGFMKTVSAALVIVGTFTSLSQAKAEYVYQFDGEIADMKPLQLAQANTQNPEQGWNQLGYLETRYKERMPLPATLQIKKKKLKVAKPFSGQRKRMKTLQREIS
jgi:hypothetical protein